MIGVREDTDLALSIPLQPLYEEFACPVCYQVMQHCAMTPCGHNFCLACINGQPPFCSRAIAHKHKHTA